MRNYNCFYEQFVILKWFPPVGICLQTPSSHCHQGCLAVFNRPCFHISIIDCVMEPIQESKVSSVSFINNFIKVICILGLHI